MTNMETMRSRYLHRLSQIFPNIASASTEIINLSSILNLPKGTEHFITDIHGEYEAFLHVLKNGSGSVRIKVTELFGKTLSDDEIRELCTLIYYPTEKIDLVAKSKTKEEMEKWYRIMLYRLITVCKYTASKYTRSKVRKAMPPDFAYVIDELITERSDSSNKEAYYEEIINTIIRTGQADRLIVALSHLIPRLTVDHLHVLGDIYDRGSGAPDIMDKLMEHHNLDIQWGNHDMVWMGASIGQPLCIANVIRVSARYGNLDTIEDNYGINLLPLASFAEKVYGDDPCDCFVIKDMENSYDTDITMNMKIHKAISVIQFKLQGQFALEHPDWSSSEDRAVFNRVDFERGVFFEDGKEYKMLDMNFPTVDPEDPNRLTLEEEDVMNRLVAGFTRCKRLKEHMNFLLSHGSLYKVINGNLLYHGCMPLNKDGSFREVTLWGETLSGRALYDKLDYYVRRAFLARKVENRERAKDILWWIWTDMDSPLFGKYRMATFERYFLADTNSHKEKKNPYYSLLNNEHVVEQILHEFDLYENAHIVNGHVPVKREEEPIHCNGKLLIIDGGFSKAYQRETGIAGYTLTYNSWGLRLVSHEPFTSTEDAISKDSDIHSSDKWIEKYPEQLTVRDTDTGRAIQEEIDELYELLGAYRHGEIVEK
jgi:fructose-1,6-bisphosphatase-3